MNTSTSQRIGSIVLPAESRWHYVTADDRSSWTPAMRDAMANEDVSARMAIMLVVNELHVAIRHVISYSGPISGLSLALTLARRACESLERREEFRDALETGTVETSLLAARRLVWGVDERVGF